MRRPNGIKLSKSDSWMDFTARTCPNPIPRILPLTQTSQFSSTTPNYVVVLAESWWSLVSRKICLKSDSKKQTRTKRIEWKGIVAHVGVPSIKHLKNTSNKNYDDLIWYRSQTINPLESHKRYLNLISTTTSPEGRKEPCLPTGWSLLINHLLSVVFIGDKTGHPPGEGRHAKSTSSGVWVY